MRGSDDIETTSRVRPPAMVETQIVKRSLRWECDGFAFYSVM